MNGQSKLVQRYYTLEETAARLRGSGAELNSATALLRDEIIDLSMVWNSCITLVKTDDVIPINITWSPYYEKYNLNGFINMKVYEPAEVGGLLENLDSEEWLISKAPINIEHNFCEKKELFPIDFSTSSPLETLTISPSSLNNKGIGRNVNLFGISYQLAPENITSEKRRLITLINGEQYYVCHATKPQLILTGEKSITAQEKRQLFSVLTKDSLKNSACVVTKEAIEIFEKKILLKRDSTESKKKTRQELRIKALEELIEECGEDSFISDSRIDVWHKLTAYDCKLFPKKNNASHGTVKGFFDNQKALINFRRGRKTNK